MVDELGGKPVRGHTGGGPGSGIGSALGWFADGSYTVVALGNYDFPGAPALYRRIMQFLAAQ